MADYKLGFYCSTYLDRGLYKQIFELFIQEGFSYTDFTRSLSKDQSPIKSISRSKLPKLVLSKSKINLMLAPDDNTKINTRYGLDMLTEDMFGKEWCLLTEIIRNKKGDYETFIDSVESLSRLLQENEVEYVCVFESNNHHRLLKGKIDKKNLEDAILQAQSSTREA